MNKSLLEKTADKLVNAFIKNKIIASLPTKFTKKLSELTSKNKITVNCLHPGFVKTEFGKNNKGFVGFVGGPWTILSYGLNYKNKSMVYLDQEDTFIQKILYDVMIPLLRKNIAMQLEAGAEYVYIFDTNSSQLDNNYFKNKYLQILRDELFNNFAGKVAYFSKSTDVFNVSENNIKNLGLAGLVYPESTGFLNKLKNNKKGFIQGNFSPKSLLKPHELFVKDFNLFLGKMKSLDQNQRSGWGCSLSHGVLPKTPEINVRYFIDKIRSSFSETF